MKIILQNSNLVFSTLIEKTTNLWGSRYSYLKGPHTIQNIINSYWAPNDIVNYISVGKTIYGVTFKSSSPSKTFQVALNYYYLAPFPNLLNLMNFLCQKKKYLVNFAGTIKILLFVQK